jgi:asparagine synthase (glutamine-hydrolysing)
MCGIVGELNKNLCRINSSSIEDMCNQLIHSGLDDRGVWVDKENGIGLGHRRLSVIDLSASANQPMVYNDLIIVFKREICY